MLTRVHRDYINKVFLRLVGRTAIADIEHVGRRSGRIHHTPVRAFRHGDTVVVGLNFGRQSDWAKNVMAAGGCRMRLRDQVMDLIDPRVVPIAQGARNMPWVIGRGLRYIVRTTDCLEMAVRSSVPAAAVARRRGGHPGS